MGLSTGLRYVSLFSGAGGLDLAVRVACPDARCLLYVEIEAFAIEILATRMQQGWLDDAPVFTDIRTLDARPFRGHVDLVIAGFPCQPSSNAGQRKGIEDERWLWDDIVRVLRDMGPRYVFLENVRGLLSVSGGRAFGAVLGDLADLGYSVEWQVLGANEVGAPHKRERVFIFAQLANCHHKAESTLPQHDEPWIGVQSPEGRARETFAHDYDADDPDGIWDIGDGWGKPPWPFCADVADAESRGTSTAQQPGQLRRSEQSNGDVAYPQCAERRQGDGCGGRGGQGINGTGQAASSPGIGGDHVVNAAIVAERESADEADAEPDGRQARDESGDGGSSLGYSGDARPSLRSRVAGDSNPQCPDSERAGGIDVGDSDGLGGIETVGWQPYFDRPFPPGPSDTGWADIIRVAPWLAPAVESSLRVLAHEPPVLVGESRVDQLRCVGNGVVVGQAALALAHLARRAGVTL